jgi:hypothetical protein
MFALELTGAARRARTATLCATVLLPWALSGCASNSANSSANTSVLSWRLSGDEPRPTPPVQKVDLEDDGLPAQTAPSFRVRQAADDPSQPWSPNYGRAPGAISPSSQFVIHNPPAPAAPAMPDRILAPPMHPQPVFSRNVHVRPPLQRVASRAPE